MSVYSCFSPPPEWWVVIIPPPFSSFFYYWYPPSFRIPYETHIFFFCFSFLFTPSALFTFLIQLVPYTSIAFTFTFTTHTTYYYWYYCRFIVDNLETLSFKFVLFSLGWASVLFLFLFFASKFKIFTSFCFPFFYSYFYSFFSKYVVQFVLQ